MSLARSIFRLAFALVFGLTSLVHGPALIVQAAAAQPCHEAAFAAGPSQDAMTSHGATGHAATDASQPQPAKSKATDPAICPMPNCFLMVTPDWPAGPPPARSAGRIEPAVMPEPGALAPDLSDPPPRLRA